MLPRITGVPADRRCRLVVSNTATPTKSAAPIQGGGNASYNPNLESFDFDKVLQRELTENGEQIDDVMPCLMSEFFISK